MSPPLLSNVGKHLRVLCAGVPLREWSRPRASRVASPLWKQAARSAPLLAVLRLGFVVAAVPAHPSRAPLSSALGLDPITVGSYAGLPLRCGWWLAPLYSPSSLPAWRLAASWGRVPRPAPGGSPFVPAHLVPGSPP